MALTYPPVGTDPCSWESAISRRDLWELTAQLSQLVERHGAGGYARDNTVPEEGPFGRSQTLKGHRLRQPAPSDLSGMWNVMVFVEVPGTCPGKVGRRGNSYFPKLPPSAFPGSSGLAKGTGCLLPFLSLLRKYGIILFSEIKEKTLACPICDKRKVKRLCPARAESICSICCGTEREVTIDCPSDCVYLVASREYDMTRLEYDWAKVPFADVKFNRSFAKTHETLLIQIDYAICQFAADHREVVDTDVLVALQTLAETYRTQTSGIIYEKPLDYWLQRGLYENLKASIADFRKDEAQRGGMTTLRDSDIRDALIFLTQLCAVHANGRPKGRAYLDIIRQQFPKEEFQKAGSNILLL